MRVLWWWISRIVIFLFLLAFALKNAGPVNVRFFFDIDQSAPLALVVFVSFAVGTLFGVLSLLASVFSLRRENKRLKQEIKSKPIENPSSVSTEPSLHD